MTNKKDLAIVKEFHRRVSKHIPIIDCKLYGSRAKGNYSSNSDYDIFLIVEKLDNKTEEFITDIAWEVGYENGVILTTMTYSLAEFQNSQSRYSLFLKNVEKDGITV